MTAQRGNGARACEVRTADTAEAPLSACPYEAAYSIVLRFGRRQGAVAVCADHTAKLRADRRNDVVSVMSLVAQR